MSKQSDVKKSQGYDPKPIPRNCGSCKHFLSEWDWPAWMKDGSHNNLLKYDGYRTESNKRCGLGGFAVKKSGICNEWMGKD